MTARDSNHSRSKNRDRQSRLVAIFNGVVSCYVRMKGLPVVTVRTLDPDPLPTDTKNQCWTPTTGEYVADVEIATVKALDSLGGGELLEAAWFRLAAGESVEPALAHKVMAKCGAFYETRRLHRYFGSDLRKLRRDE